MTVPVVYPDVTVLPGLDIKVLWRPKALNFAPQAHASGREVIVGAAAYPLHEFELIYNMLRNRTPTEIEFKTFMGFFLQSGGTLNGFLFLNPYDHQVTGNVIAAGDGATTKFTLTRTYGAGGFAGVEPIGYLNYPGATFNVYVNGVLKTLGSDYNIDQTFPGRQTITFATAPPLSQHISIDASYWYFCRFADDMLEFEQVLWNIFEVQKVVLLSKRGPF
jgi:uncharacterized protein (TIGR02217 family)